MASIDQPDGMVIDNGLIVTVGFFVNTDRVAMVFPMCTDSTIDKNSSAGSLAGAFGDAIVSKIAACMAETNTFARFTQVEGMVDGIVPGRDDYVPIDYPGTRDGTPLPSQVAALMYFYEDGRDVETGKRVACGRNFIPGISETDVTGTLISSDLQSAMNTLAEALQNGVDDEIGATWYRILAKPQGETTGGSVKRTYQFGSRGYVCTQKRRLLPRL